jgi:hypothetical protein
MFEKQGQIDVKEGNDAGSALLFFQALFTNSQSLTPVHPISIDYQIMYSYLQFVMLRH